MGDSQRSFLSGAELTPGGCGLASCRKFLDGCPQVLHRILHMWTICEKVPVFLAIVKKKCLGILPKGRKDWIPDHLFQKPIEFTNDLLQ